MKYPYYESVNRHVLMQTQLRTLNYQTIYTCVYMYHLTKPSIMTWKGH